MVSGIADDGRNDTERNQSETIFPLADTSSAFNDSLLADSLRRDSIMRLPNPLTDSVPFNVVIGVATSKKTALSRLAKLKSYGRNVIMYTNDSITFKVAHPFMLPLPDTTRVLDSLNKYFYQGKAYIEVR